MKKRLFSLLMSTILLLLLCIPASASGELLVDDADLLSESEEASLLSYLSSYSSKYDCDIVVVTVPSLYGQDVQAYADDYYDYSGYSGNGVLFLLSMEEREFAYSTTGWVIDAFDDDRYAVLDNELIPYLSDGRYYEAFVRYAELCDNYLANPLPTGEFKAVHTFPIFGTSVFAIILGLIVALIGTSVLKGKMKTVKAQNNAAEYVKPGSFDLKVQRDSFLYANVSKRARTQDTGSRSGGSHHGGGMHISSSGISHGGHSGRF